MSSRSGSPPDAPAAPRKYGDAEGYDAYMGGWSAALSPPFIAFAGSEPRRVLDVGCGTGNLLAALRARWPHAAVTGIDPSSALLAKARGRRSLAGAELFEAKVEHLPFAAHTFDQTLSMLVLQEFGDRLAALAEMRRVTVPGGIVAGCQWDFAKMPVIAGLVEAIVAVDAAAEERINANSPRVFDDEAELRDWWQRAGFSAITTGRIAVTRDFANLDEIWRPLRRGATPSTLTLASLAPNQQAQVRSLIREHLGAIGDEPLKVTAEALVVRGRA